MQNAPKIKKVKYGKAERVSFAKISINSLSENKKREILQKNFFSCRFVIALV